MHAPLLTAEVPGANPGVGNFILSRSTSGTDEETVLKTAAPNQRPECDSLVLRQSPPLQPGVVASLFSSVAQQQSTRLITGRPWSVTTQRDFLLERWMAQTDERRIEAPHRLARYQLQRPFPRGLDVTASMSVFQTERAGAAPAGRTFFISLPSWCNSSIPPCDGDGAGADPAEGTFLTNGVFSR